MIKVSARSNFSSVFVFIKKFCLAELVLKKRNAFTLIKTLFRINREASLVNMQIRLISDKKLKRHQRSAYRAMQRRKTLRSLEAVGRRPKEFERASGGLFSPRSNKVNFNKDKQTQTKTAPLGATNSPKVKDQQFFSSHLQLGMATDPIFVDVTVEVMQGYSGSCFHLFLTATQLNQQN